jgi:hypothetical protein
LLGLLKKSVPDTAELVVGGMDSKPVTVEVGLAREKLFSRIAALVSAVPAPKVLP